MYPYLLDIVLGEKYKIFPAGFSNITWEQALRNCMDIGAGWDLVKIQSKAEDLVIKDMLKCEGGMYMYHYHFNVFILTSNCKVCYLNIFKSKVYSLYMYNVQTLNKTPPNIVEDLRFVKISTYCL